MALLKCPECNKEISDQAEKCPQCGYPLQKKSSDNVIITEDKKRTTPSLTVKILAAIGGVIGLLALLSGFKDLLFSF